MIQPIVIPPIDIPDEAVERNKPELAMIQCRLVPSPPEGLELMPAKEQASQLLLLFIETISGYGKCSDKHSTLSKWINKE